MDMDERRREGRRGAKRIGRTGLEGKEGEERGMEEEDLTPSGLDPIRFSRALTPSG